MTSQNQTNIRESEFDRSRQRKVPSRVLERPDPAQWGDQELMNFKEAIALFWPAGPLTIHSLRTAHRQGQLGVAVIAGKFLTTKAAIAEMGSCVRKTKATAPESTANDRETARARAALMVRNFKIRMEDKLAK
jgi:hypothetical protein